MIQHSLKLLTCLALSACGAEPTPAPKAPVTHEAARSNEGPGGTRYTGGDGLTCEQAVRIEGASSSDIGMKSQHAWIRERYPRSRKLARDSIRCEGRPVERIVVATETGQQVEVFFDISDFIGKS